MGFDFMGLWLWVCQRGFMVAWVCGYGFTGMGLWWLGFVGMGLPPWVCGGLGLWVWVCQYGFVVDRWWLCAVCGCGGLRCGFAGMVVVGLRWTHDHVLATPTLYHDHKQYLHFFQWKRRVPIRLIFFFIIIRLSTDSSSKSFYGLESLRVDGTDSMELSVRALFNCLTSSPSSAGTSKSQTLKISSNGVYNFNGTRL